MLIGNVMDKRLITLAIIESLPASTVHAETNVLKVTEPATRNAPLDESKAKVQAYLDQLTNKKIDHSWSVNK